MIDPSPDKSSKKRIVILGGGFGGVYAAMHLEKLLARESPVKICLVSGDNFSCSRRCFTKSQRAIVTFRVLAEPT
jgi:NADH dehydrogenase FAD-containing subunit